MIDSSIIRAQIRVYQILNDRSLDVPDLHRLLNVRYVGAHASGWQVNAYDTINDDRENFSV